MGLALIPHVYSDSSGARGIARRAGSGKVSHLETKDLWVQAAVKESAAVNAADTPFCINARE